MHLPRGTSFSCDPNTGERILRDDTTGDVLTPEEVAVRCLETLEAHIATLTDNGERCLVPWNPNRLLYMSLWTHVHQW